MLLLNNSVLVLLWSELKIDLEFLIFEFSFSNKGQIGITVDTSYFQPKTDSNDDKVASELALQFYVSTFYLFDVFEFGLKKSVLNVIEFARKRCCRWVLCGRSFNYCFTSVTLIMN